MARFTQELSLGGMQTKHCGHWAQCHWVEIGSMVAVFIGHWMATAGSVAVVTGKQVCRVADHINLGITR